MPTTLRPIDVVTAGHICLDVIPQLPPKLIHAGDMFVPGGLVQVGPATLALGGSVANTGIALHRLGAMVRLMGKVGDDLLGETILQSLRRTDPRMTEGMIIAPGEATSYTIVISPTNTDRGFLHYPGTNDTFVAGELSRANWNETRLVHFGYPPLMRGTFADGGRALAHTFAEIQAAGALVSLDMAVPEVDDTNWRQWLATVLPYVDLFVPSYDELETVLNVSRNFGPTSTALGRLSSLAGECHDLGVPIVLIKLGDRGLYLRTNDQVAKLARREAWRSFNWLAWNVRELQMPCFDVNVVGTTGSGDCTIAGLLMSLIQGRSPEDALRFASAVGAYCVQSADAVSNIPDWPHVLSAINEMQLKATPCPSANVPEMGSPNQCL